MQLGRLGRGTASLALHAAISGSSQGLLNCKAREQTGAPGELGGNQCVGFPPYQQCESAVTQPSQPSHCTTQRCKQKEGNLVQKKQGGSLTHCFLPDSRVAEAELLQLPPRLARF